MTKSSRMGWAIVALATLGLVAPATGADRELINVYCAGAGVDGFLSPDVGDSTKDVTKFLRGKKKTLRLVETEADADLIVTITGREVQGTGKKEYTTRSSGKGSSRKTTSSSKEKTVKVVFVTLQAGKYQMEMEGVDSGFWSAAAHQLAGKIDKWIKQNHAQIISRRGT